MSSEIAALNGLGEFLRPPPKRTLSMWADEHFVLSAESAATPGPWRTLPYQRAIMDAITDRRVERVVWMKSARVGATKVMDAAVGYYMHNDPCPILVVQPTVEDAEGYSKEEIAPMLRDCPVLTDLVSTAAKTSSQTILHKSFPGGILSMAGANSGRGFRRVSRQVVIFDEVDGYPASAGNEGDQIQLGIRRTEYYWNRKIIAASTPLIAGISRIERMFLDGDQRYYHVPCPHCGHMDFLAFRPSPDGTGHVMKWDDGEPNTARFVCSGCHEDIDERHKFAMLEAGEWRAEGEFTNCASFHIWAAYSMSPNASWPQIAREFLAAKDTPGELKTFVNTVLGETWTEQGEAPDWEVLFNRRESYDLGSIPIDDCVAVTCGVDVQKDHFVYEIVAWRANRESYSIDIGTIWGDNGNEEDWAGVDELLERTFEDPSGRVHRIRMLAIDSSAFTQNVYNWGRRHPYNRVIACKGADTARTLVSAPSAVEVDYHGRRIQRGYRVWITGVSIAKGELYSWLRLKRKDDGTLPNGYCHFPEYHEEFFKQLTGEHLVPIKTRTGHMRYEWQVQPGRENHWLDTRVLNRVAVSVLGLDRLPASAPEKPTKKHPAAKPSPAKPARGNQRRRRGNWFKRRR